MAMSSITEGCAGLLLPRVAIFEKYLAWQDGLSEWVGRIIAWLPLVLVLILLIEVFFRYFLNAPTIWGHELSAMLFGAFAILSGSYTLKAQAYVRSDVIYVLLPRWLQKICDVFVQVLVLVVLTIFFLMAIEVARKSSAFGEMCSKSIWQRPLYYIKSVFPIALGLLILHSIAELLRALCRLFGAPFHDPRQTSDEH